MIKLFNNKRGVSPVVSAVIMILVVMISMSALFGFFVNYSRDFQTGSGGAVFESMTVEDVWFRDGNTAAEIWIYNFGKADLTITNVYVDNNAVDFSPTDLLIAVGEHRNITVSSGFESGTYQFKIVTARGTSFEGSYTR